MTEEKKKFRPSLPPWIRVRVSCGEKRDKVAGLLDSKGLHTVCQGAKCPNQCECWHRGTATFMILGERCTRNCRFCAVGHVEKPLPPDLEEPRKLAETAARMKLSYVVVTSVTRDDLSDGGAAIFADTIRELRKTISGVKVEVLVPDFNGEEKDIRTVLDAHPDVFNHNVETVERLSPLIRSKAQYRRSLEVLGTARRISAGKAKIKSGIMVGMGETDEEVLQTIRDIREAGADMITIGQYLPPSKEHWELQRYVEPSVFDEWGRFAKELGFTHVASAPLVRSSYNAEELESKKTP